MLKQTYYPVNLAMRGRRCVVIGAGSVAERKTRSLVAAGGDVRVVSPSAGAGIRELARKGAIGFTRDRYHSRYIAGASLVIAATDDERINARAARDAARRGILINVVDNPALSGFIVPAVLRRGSLTVSVSTGGESPLFAQWLRDELGKVVGPEYAAHVRSVAKRRKAMKERAAADSGERRGYLW